MILAMPGKKTSVWLGQDELDGWQELGASLTVIVKAGIAALRAERDGSRPEPGDVADNIRMIRDTISVLPDEDEVRTIVREEVAAFPDDIKRIVRDAIRDASTGG